ECMYLHEVADMEVSFTKDDMHQGRHADYERRLAEQVLNCTVDQKHHRRSPKLKQRDQQTTDGDAPAHRQSRNHNAPPRHRNKQTSKSVERSAPKPVHNPHHRTCSNHSLSKEAALGEQPSPATSNPQTGESTPAQMVGSVPNESSSSMEQDGGMRMSVDQRDWNGPAVSSSRLLTWTQTGASSTTDSLYTGDAGYGRSPSPSANGANSQSVLRGGTCDSVEKAQFMCNGLERVDAMPSMGGSTGDEVAQTTDWQAAFGLKPMGMGGTSRPRLPSLSDDDLGFDPFSESSKGLADLLEEEKLEQKERQQQRLLPDRHGPYGNTAPSSTAGQTGSYGGGWNMNGRQQSSQYVMGPSWDKPSSSFSQSGMVRPHGSPIPQQFTTPPPSLPSQMPNGQYDGNKHYHNGGFGGGHELSNGMRGGFGSHGMQHPPSLGFPPPGLSLPPPSHQRPLSPHDQSPHATSSMTEWQEGLKALLPNVNVHFAPELHSPGGASKQSPSNGPMKAPNRNWMRHPPPMPPFTQPPPPLSVSTNFGGPPTSSMRPSPTSAPSDPFSHHQINGPTSRPPPGYPTDDPFRPA
uniref:Uncharacterized protein n=1 Tax=Plectus sambesii TaxID=2011161 RepID=A0A914UM28_9BILA